MTLEEPTERARLRGASPAELRARIRRGGYTGLTTGLAPGVLQGNLAVVPNGAADGFEAFCRANPAALPLIERGAPGDPRLACAEDFDVRTDLSGYILWRDGAPCEWPADIAAYWTSGMTAFALGCWFANEAALAAAGIRMRHVEEGVQGSLFRSSLPAVTAGRFSAMQVVSMRPFAAADLPRVRDITARLPEAHGAPLHSGDPEALGIFDIAHPDFGEALPPEPGEVPVFWPCGLTGQEALARAGLPFFITHRPGCMVVTDIPARSAS